MKFKPSLAAAITLGLLSTPAYALKEGDWLAKVGAINVNPNDSSTGFSGAPTVGATTKSDTQVSLTLTYMVQDNIGVELLLATPFTHDVYATGAGAALGKVADAKQLPPTLSVQYYFSPQEKMRPYASLGLNFTNFFDINVTDGSATLTDLDLDDSWGLAAQVGVDYDMGDDWFINLDIRYINIETTGTSNLGNIDIDVNPTIITVGAGFAF
jgi:outer membrane protein